MKIRESKNLKYTKLPFYRFETIEKVEPSKCPLEDFHDLDDRIELHFKNGTVALIEAIDPSGGTEIDKIVVMLNGMIGRSYEEILSTDF